MHMKKTTLSIGATLMLGLLALTVVQPALAGHRDHDRRHCRHDNHQPFSQSYYNHQYSRYQDHRYGRHGRKDHRYGRHGHNRHGYGNQYNNYGAYYGGYNQGYGNKYRRHYHRHGLVQLRHRTRGFAYCDAHNGYYRKGDMYY
jgi:hypothetical protein